MVDLTSITAGLGGIKTAIDIANTLREADTSLQDAENKIKLADLISALADAKIEIAAIRELLVDKDAEISNLKEQLNQKDSLKWDGTVYLFQDNDSGDEVGICPQCYDAEKKVMRLHTDRVIQWYCTNCDKGFGKTSHTSYAAPERTIF